MRSVFVDVARNFGATLRAEKSKDARINYEKYLKKAINGDRLHRACAYGINIGDEAHEFKIILEKIGYEVKYKPARMVLDRTTNQYVPKINLTSNNINIAIDIVKDVEKVDTIVLGTNDKELIPFIIWAQSKGVKIHLFSLLIPKDMKEVANSWHEIDGDIIE